MHALPLIRRLREHQRWANARCLEAADTLTPEQLHQALPVGQGSVLNTLTHLYAAEYVWLEAMRGNTRPLSPWAFVFDDLDALREAWAELDARWAAFFDDLTDADLGKPITKTSTSSGKGKTFTTPMSDVLLHVSTHAAYTMAQLNQMLRQLGRADLCVDVMLITMSRDASTLTQQ